MTWWIAAGLVAGIFCLARGAVDLWQRNYVWGVLSIVIGCVLLLTPIQTLAVKFDLPAPSQH
jgi:hypothetical protein